MKNMPHKASQPRYFLYARKSSESEDRQVQSIDDQVKRLIELATNLNLDVKQVYTEAKSAKQPDNRPGFEEIIQRIEDGDAEGILCWQINRLSRNPIDSAKIQWLLQQGTLRSIQTVDREYQPEDNVLLFSVESGMANQFVLDLSKNVKRGMRSKVEKGIYPHTAPSGYKNDTVNHTIVVDRQRFPLLRRAWDLMLTGNYTPTQIVDILNDDWGYRSLKRKRMGGTPMARSGMYSMLSNRFYAGYFEWNSQIYKGQHKAMVTLEEFDTVQALLEKNGKPKPQKHTFAYTGLIRCGECGCMVTAERKNRRLKNGGINQHTYYHCTKRKRGIKCSQGCITERALEEQIDVQLKTITIRPEFRTWALDILNRENDQEISQRTQIHENLSKTLLQTQAQLDNLTKMRCRDLITDVEYTKERQTLQQEIFKLRERLRATENRTDRWLELTEKTFNFVTYARSHFLDGDLQTKKGILQALGSNLILTDKKLALQAHSWLIPLAENYPALEREFRRFEPTKNRLNKSKNEAFASLIPRWQAIVDDVRTAVVDRVVQGLPVLIPDLVPTTA